MKKLAGLVVILAILILGSYYGFGIITERTLKKNIVLIEQSNNGVQIEIEKYHRGFCHSNALLNWRMQVPARIVKNQVGEDVSVPAQEYKMQIPLDIFHGPMMVVDSKPMFGLGYARSHVVLSEPYKAQFSTAYTDASIAPVLNVSVFVSYLNNSTIRMNMPVFKLISKTGNSQMDWLGMTSDIRISSNSNQVSGQVNIDGARLKTDKAHVDLGKVDSDFNLHKTKFDFYLGDANILLPSLVVMQDDKKVLDVQQFDVHSNSDINDNLFNSHVKLTLAKVLSDDKTYGPALLDVSLRNLDAEVLARMNTQANDLQQGSDNNSQKALLMLLPELPKLLNKGAQFEISELNVGMPEGVIKGKLLISLPAELTENPFQLIQKIKGDGQIVISKSVLKQLLHDSVKQSLLRKEAAVTVQTVPASPSTPDVSVQVIANQGFVEKQVNEKLTTMVNTGLLSAQGSDYVIEFKLADGRLDVNGKPFDSTMMKF